MRAFFMNVAENLLNVVNVTVIVTTNVADTFFSRKFSQIEY
ncbi:hypothetical protein VCRA2119O147_380048 [Vibrio crassostreae]|nr:hypothetical protein VCRA2110O4_120034 [Vibrio crassostreae]CAK1840070.1 hypothetical protein VCRA2113O196_10028 [Vibrio crassostreae]CAK1845160.1 hypothetical protein VCRA2113O138_10199 [Vibrio crassostreae]CAK1848306.1 hypothetical protein VCRA2113O222_10337 [Vibrio crassostreae]CAK1848719.1 hypothetical protein VCRA2119O245_10341 [Vibrio crassostreae]